MTARFWSWPASEPAKSRTLTAAVAPRIVEASIAIGRLRPRHSRTRWREKLDRTSSGPVVIIDRQGPTFRRLVRRLMNIATAGGEICLFNRVPLNRSSYWRQIAWFDVSTVSVQRHRQ